MALTVATVPGDRRLVRELAGTLATVFPEVRVWPVLTFNHIVVGDTRPPARIEQNLLFDIRPQLIPLQSLLHRQLGPPVAPAADPWTDDHAPVEWITDRMIIAYAARGGELDEQLLPTAP